MKIPTFIVVGAGQRGFGYTSYIHHYPNEGKVVGVCEPNQINRNIFTNNFSIPRENVFNSWEELAGKPKLADAVIICTQDRMHKDPAIAFAKKGYHILLEKPMATNPEDCISIYKTIKDTGVMFAVCHVLRYTDFNIKLKEMIDSGIIGKIRNIQLLEPVGFAHYAHSFVRGNWRNENESSFMLLAKSCHDIDLINYFINKKCTKVSSFGSLSYFTKENQPKGAADRCINCPEEIESKCAYSALKMYLRGKEDNLNQWPISVLTPIPTVESVSKALEKGPYGRCVYACDNDVVDKQIVNLEFEDGAEASFTMSAFNKGGGREIYIMGDQGTLRCDDNGIEHYDFLTQTTNKIDLYAGDGQITSGHGGGDFGLMKSFLKALKENNPIYISSGPEISLISHLMVFAAEKSRKSETIEKINIDLDNI
ncbi:MAG: Gfo/Idh/MocA family oxidoreductase [Armatimonadota bacterium]